MRPNLTDASLYAGDPHPTYRWLRANAPVYRDEASDLWVLSRYEDVFQVSKTPEIFSAAQGVLPDSEALVSIVSMDDPRHARLRKLVNKGFTPRMVGLLVERIRELAREIADDIAERGRCDLVRDVAVPLPLYIIAEMLGIRREDFDRFHSWSDRLIGISGNYHDPVKVNESVTAFMEYGNYLQDVFEERRREPREDLVTILLQAQQDGVLAEDEESMENDEIVMFMTLLLVAGNETTRNAISGGMLALMQNREQLELLRSRPDLLDCAAEEILRYVSPIICFRRTTTRDTEVRGQAIRAGERVAMLYQSANRDDDVYAEPDRFDVTRQPNPHLAFGIGPHFCLGANLARMELKVMVQELVQRFPDIRPMPGTEVKRAASTLVAGIDELHVELTSAG
ncbi:MAG TPA: cytochrome P450 [Candidatus Binatia bacterium]|nr:cytochrome P450 [Candidatus Binatia bacterium]